MGASISGRAQSTRHAATAEDPALARSRLQALSTHSLRAMLIGAALVVIVSLLVAPRMAPRSLWIGIGACLAALALRAWLVARLGRTATEDLRVARRLELAAVFITFCYSAYVAWLAGTGPALTPERQAALGALALAGCLGAISTLVASPLMFAAVTAPLFVGSAGALLQLGGDSMPLLMLGYGACAALLIEMCWRAVRSHQEALRAELRERALTEQQWTLFEAAPAGVALTHGTRLTRASSRLKTWFGPDAGSVRSELARAVGRDDLRLDRLVARAEARVVGHQVREFEVVVRSGSGPRCLGIQVRRFDPLRPTEGLLWMITDRSAEYQHRQGLERDAQHDPLTGALNRRGLSSALGPLLSRDLDKRPLGVMCMDLNGFKPLNDRHGHAFGDRVLCTINERLKRALRGTDLVARPGGDEFVIVLDPLDDAKQAAAIADRISEVIAAPMLLEGVPCQVQASIGLAVAPGDGRDPEMLIECADRAMYEVKRAISPGPPRPAARSGQDRRSPR